MHLRFLLAFSILVSSTSRALAGEAIAVTFSGNVHKFTGSVAGAAFVGASGFSALNSLAKSVDNRFIASSGGNASTPAKLIEINRLTGVGTLLGSLAINGDVRGLAFDVDGTLLAAVRTTTTALWRIDPDTLQATLLGATGLSGIQALAVSPQGIVFGWDAGSTGTNGLGLIKLSPANGAVSDVNASIGGDATIQSLSFDEVGTLFGLRHELYRIDTNTGAKVQLAGTNADDFRGFEYLESMSHRDGALGVFADGHVGRLNTHTGDATSFGSTAVSPVNALVRRFAPKQFLAAVGASPSLLYFVNEGTGVLTFDKFLGADNVRAMAIDPQDTLYFVGDDATTQEGFFVSPFLGQAQFVGATGLTDIRSMARSPFGTLYAWDAVAGLVTINPINGAASDVNPAVNGQAFEALAFDPTGHLIAANDSAGIQGVFEIDVLTGVATLRGVHPIGDFRGIAFFFGYEPELPTIYCTSQTNSAGCAPAISFHGPNVPSATLHSAFTIDVVGTVAGKSGLFFYGLSGRQSTPFLGGTLCMTAPLARTPVQQPGAALCNGAPAGFLSIDFNAYIASHEDPRLVAGVVVAGQWWSRDPAASSTTNLSNAIEFEIAP